MKKLTDGEVKKKARAALERAKAKKREINREIRRLESEAENEEAVIIACLTILDGIEEREAGDRE